MAIQRGSSRNADNVVDSRSDRSKCQRGAVMPWPVIDSASTAMKPAAAQAPNNLHCRPAISPMRMTNGSATMTMP